MAGIALFCGTDGVVREVVRDEIGIGLTAGQHLSAVVSTGTANKARLFLEELRSQGAAFEWELEVSLPGEIRTLSVAGIQVGESLLVIGASVLDDVFGLYEELARVNNEQTTLLRRAIKERVLVTQQGARSDLLEELSLVNNDLVNLQREQAKKNQLLERLDQQKNAFLGMAAHDLRNPIASVDGYARLLLELELPLDIQRQTLESISRVARQMLQLVNDLLDVSVIESGKLLLRRETVQLDELVRGRMKFFQLLANKKEIQLLTELAQVALPLDPARTEQVIDNLVSNAIKYSPRGASVWVRVGAIEDTAWLEVRDEGPGLSAADQERLFGTFQRLSSRPTGDERSTGLGLAITARIVKAHGGEIKVQSALGEGSVFTVVLPLVSGASEEGR